MKNKTNPKFFVDAYASEHPEVKSKVKSGKMDCPFEKTYIKGMNPDRNIKVTESAYVLMKDKKLQEKLYKER